jgi:hypothetical protein
VVQAAPIGAVGRLCVRVAHARDAQVTASNLAADHLGAPAKLATPVLEHGLLVGHSDHAQRQLARRVDVEADHRVRLAQHRR